MMISNGLLEKFTALLLPDQTAKIIMNSMTAVYGLALFANLVQLHNIYISHHSDIVNVSTTVVSICLH